MSTSIDPTALADAIDHIAITRLQAQYGDVVTRQAWDELGQLFLAECPVRLDLRNGTTLEMNGPEELASFIANSISQFEFFAFTILNSVVEIDPAGRSATGRLYIQELRNGAADHRWTTIIGLYRDTYRKVAGRWWFASREYSSLARDGAEGEGMVVFPIPGR
jgi:hypothetical protein